MKILVYGTNWLGDAVMSLPTLASLRMLRPKDDLVVLSPESLREVYAGSPVDSVLARPSNGFSAVRALRRHSFDAALLLPRSFRAALLTWLAGIPRRIGFADEGRSILLTDPVPRSPDLLQRHRVHYYHHLLSAFGVPSEPAAPRIVPSEEARAWARGNLPSGAPLIALNPGATYGIAKQWFPDRFAGVARRLIASHRARIVLVGGPSEAALADEIGRRIGNAVNLAGRTGILQLAAVLEASQLLLTNDTGPMHVADAVGTPIVAVYGPTDPVTTPPFGAGHRIVRRPIECSPCLQRTCPLGHHRCMTEITEEEVYATCLRLLAESPR